MLAAITHNLLRGLAGICVEFVTAVPVDERRALSPLFWTHVNPYGRFRLDMNARIDLTGGQPAAESIL